MGGSCEMPGGLACVGRAGSGRAGGVCVRGFRGMFSGSGSWWGRGGAWRRRVGAGRGGRRMAQRHARAPHRLEPILVALALTPRFERGDEFVIRQSIEQTPEAHNFRRALDMFP